MNPVAALLKLATAAGPSDYLAARAVLRKLFPGRDKEARLIEELKTIKYESDRKNWPAKNKRLRELMRTYPDDWYVDSHAGHVVGVTHAQTGFRFHMPADVVPEHVKTNPVRGPRDKHLNVSG